MREAPDDGADAPMRIGVRRLLSVAFVVAAVTTVTLALAAEAISRIDPDGVGAASLRYCADPGYCGGNMMLTVSRVEATATTFARTWASDWNRWAATHNDPRQIVTAGCNYLATERYYLCAVRVRPHARASSGASCGLMVIKPATQPNPDDQIENGLETACRILSAYPQQIVN